MLMQLSLKSTLKYFVFRHVFKRKDLYGTIRKTNTISLADEYSSMK